MSIQLHLRLALHRIYRRGVAMVVPPVVDNGLLLAGQSTDFISLAGDDGVILQAGA